MSIAGLIILQAQYITCFFSWNIITTDLVNWVTTCFLSHELRCYLDTFPILWFYSNFKILIAIFNNIRSVPTFFFFFKSVYPNATFVIFIWLAYFPTIWQFKALQCREKSEKSKPNSLLSASSLQVCDNASAKCVVQPL